MHFLRQLSSYRALSMSLRPGIVLRGGARGWPVGPALPGGRPVLAVSAGPGWPRRAKAAGLQAGPGTLFLADRKVSGGAGIVQVRPEVSFSDTQAYEQMTATWSRLVGEDFLDWLALPRGLRWLDAGCGNGAFTRLIVERCAPASVNALDPQTEQIADARRRMGASLVQFEVGDVHHMAAHASGSFDVGVMALVLIYLPDPARAVKELTRVLAPGGVACAYNWDIPGGGSPLAPLGLAMRQTGVTEYLAPSEAISGQAAIASLWHEAALEDVATRRITVHRRFESFEGLWAVVRHAASISQALARLDPEKLEEVKARFRENLRQDTSGPVTCQATAVAVRGVVPRTGRQR